MTVKITKKLLNWTKDEEIKLIIIGICFLLLGFTLGHLTAHNKVNVQCQSNAGSNERCALTSDEACSMFFNCEYGYGTMDNLRCYCNGTWNNYNWKDLVLE